MRTTTAFLFVWIAILIFAQPTLGEQIAPISLSDPALLAAAKKDGEVVWYTTNAIEVANGLKSKFEEVYPFVRVKIFRTKSSDMVNRIIAEGKSGRHVFDVATSNNFAADVLKKQGFAKQYALPVSADPYIPKSFRDRDGYWYAASHQPGGFGYNTKLVTSPPKSLDELTSPVWKGKIGLDTQEIEWFVSELRMRGEKDGLALMKKLSQNVVLRNGHTLGSQLVLARELSLVIHGVVGTFWDLKQEGAPVDVVVPSPTQTSPTTTILSPNTRKEAAAKLFIGWQFSKETAGLIARLGKSPTRSDVSTYPPILSKTDFIVLDDAKFYEEFPKYSKMFREIFMNK